MGIKLPHTDPFEKEQPVQHSPTPWTTSVNSENSYRIRELSTKQLIAKDLSQENAAFIVKAVNAHAALAGCLIEWLNAPFFDSKEDWQKWVSVFGPKVKAALKLAKEDK